MGNEQNQGLDSFLRSTKPTSWLSVWWFFVFGGGGGMDAGAVRCLDAGASQGFNDDGWMMMGGWMDGWMLNGDESRICLPGLGSVANQSLAGSGVL